MSNETKWTKGPWVALPINTRLTGMARQPIFDDGRWVIFPEHETERLPLAEVDHGDDHHVPARKQAEHDARLIAAAPELYEALDMLMDATGPGDAAQLLAEERENIMALLAKARGEQS